MRRSNRNFSRFSLPLHWDAETVEKCIDIAEKNEGSKIHEFYGTLSSGVIGHGRTSSNVSSVTLEDARKIVEMIRSENIGFDYVLNSPVVSKDDQTVKNHISSILENLDPDALIVASERLMKLIRDVSNDVDIYVSTIAGVKDVDDVDRYRQYGVSKITLHHDGPRNFENLDRLLEIEGPDIELMVNESCLRRCPRRESHFETVGQDNDDSMFHQWCNGLKIERPEKLLNANIIRPEDVEIYEEIGVERFKITGRAKKPSWLPKVVKAYMERKFEGNLIRLTGIYSQMDVESWLYIDNQSLEGFLRNYPRKGNKADEEEYCKEWAERLESDGGLKINYERAKKILGGLYDGS